MQLEGVRHLVLVDASSPVSFFAYPGKAERPGSRGLHGPPGGRAGRRRRCGRRRPGRAAGRVRRQRAVRQPPRSPSCPPGRSPRRAVCQALGALLPEGAIVSDEGNTSGLFAPGATAGSPPHDWLCLTGGAIGQGLPVAVGAAVAAPGPTGGRPRGRRQRPLHAPVVVDHGPRGTRRDHHPPQQPLLRGAQHGARPGRASTRPGLGPGTCSTSADRPSTSCSWPGAWGSTPNGPTPPRSSPTSWPGPWPRRVRAWWRRSSPRCSDRQAPRPTAVRGPQRGARAPGPERYQRSRSGTGN